MISEPKRTSTEEMPLVAAKEAAPILNELTGKQATLAEAETGKLSPSRIKSGYNTNAKPFLCGLKHVRG